MALGINSINNANIFAKSAETVSGAELSKTARELFFANSDTPSLRGINNGAKLDVSLYGTNASNNTDAVKLAATNTAGFELNLSNKAVASLNALKANAAGNMINNTASQRKGMIHIHSEQTELKELKEAQPFLNAPSVFEPSNLPKDRRGSGPFMYIPQQDETSEKAEGLSFIA